MCPVVPCANRWADMEFRERLERTARLVDARLGELLSSGNGSHGADRLARAIRHAVMNGGKRFRPLLLMESAALFGVEQSVSLDIACALECIHCYSLVHDDLPSMDNDDVRRGQPTVHRAFDEWTAILAGDALQTLGFEILTQTEAVEAAVRCELAAAMGRAAGERGMAGGQSLDLAAAKLGIGLDMSGVRRMQEMKTGALIAFACEAGAILGRASPGERSALRDYGLSLGLAFQIADDLLDLTGTAAAVGKATAKDARLGKATVPALAGAAAARAELDGLHRTAVAALMPFGARAGILAETVRFAARRDR